MEFTQRRGLVEEVKRRRRHDRIQRPVVKRKLLGRAAQPLHIRRAGAGLVEHALGHVHAVDLRGMQVTFDSVSQNACATGDVSYARRGVRA